MSSPEVSVVMGVYNGAPRLRETLDSVLVQEGVDLEFIVVDDGSEDDTGAILQEYAAADPRMRIFEQRNLGLTRALIRGCEAAEGRFIARQDVGDVSLRGRLRKQAALLRSLSDAVMAACGCRFRGPGGENLGDNLQDYPPETWAEILRSGDEKHLRGPWHGSVMFRRADYGLVGGYRPQFRFAQDLDLWARMTSRGTVESVSEILYEVGFDYGSISVRHRVQQAETKRLIARMNLLRRSGEAEDLLLREVEAVGNQMLDHESLQPLRAEADYFVGSCLLARRDPAARRYLRHALRERPFHPRAWAKLMWSYASALRSV